MTKLAAETKLKEAQIMSSQLEEKDNEIASLKQTVEERVKELMTHQMQVKTLQATNESSQTENQELK